MALTESEELELLELEYEEAMAKKKTMPQPVQPAPQPKPTYEQRVQQKADEAAMAARRSTEKAEGINALLAPVKAFTGTVAAQMTESAPYRGAEWLAKKAAPFVGRGIESLGAERRWATGTNKQTSGTTIGETIGKNIQRAPEPVKNIAGIAGDVSMMIPGSVGIQQLVKRAPAAAGATGRAVESAGISALGGQMKIPKAIAQKGYGSRLDIKKQNILKNISKYNLESVTGNFSKMADNASRMATERVNQADEILAKIASSPDAPSGQFVDDIIVNAMDKIEDLSAVGKEGQAYNILDNIIAGATSRGMAGTGPHGVEAIIDFKRKLDPDGNLFKGGPAISDADNLDRTIRKELYRSAVEKIREISPDAAELNKQAKELIDISNAASKAAEKPINQNKIFSMSNMIVGGAGGAGAAAMQSPEVLAGTGGLLLAKKLAEQGRGPAVLMKTGKALQGKNPIGLKQITDIISNQRGSVGGYNKEALDDAIRMVIERAKNPKIETPSAAPYSKEELDDAIRIFLENFKNNRGDVSNLGILAGTGAGAAAGLGAYGAMKRKQGGK